MQPTLMGNPETQVFDRVLVDKLSFQMRDPERWEIVVFKHPLENSRIMVKRLVGMPGEQLQALPAATCGRAPTPKLPGNLCGVRPASRPRCGAPSTAKTPSAPAGRS